MWHLNGFVSSWTDVICTCCTLIYRVVSFTKVYSYVTKKCLKCCQIFVWYQYSQFIKSQFIPFFPPISAFYEEEVKNLKESKAEKLAQIEKEIEMQKKSTAGMTKKVAIEKSQMQQSNSEQYSEEVLEWQKIAKKEKSSVSMSSSVQQQSSFVTTVRTLISYR